MLTADLVRASARGGELKLTKLAGKTRVRAQEIAESFISVARAHVGRSREELHTALGEVHVEARERKLADGLKKLLEDACDFSAEDELSPPEVRSDVFLAASERRRSLEKGEQFDRDQILTEVGNKLGVEPQRVEGALFADLKNAHVLQGFSKRLDAERLVKQYDLGSRQAVLLKAVKVMADVKCKDPAAYRRLFRELKFRRLLYRIEQRGDRYRIEIDGPFSLFESVTKYGLQLAFVLPALEQADELDLVAELKWGKRKQRLSFQWSCKRKGAEHVETEPPEELAGLLSGFEAKAGGWCVTQAEDILDLPGVGLCVPDLRFEHPKHGVVFLELMGFWSRDAVWKRVELAQAGLPYRVLFAVSSRLRVSEGVLDADTGSALVVYKGSLSTRAVQQALKKLIQD